MNETKATAMKGPWKAARGAGAWQFKRPAIEIAAANGNIIAVMVEGYDADRRDEDEANAHLIAAAPDLLAALEAAVSNPDVSAWLTKAEAAILKAKGVTQ